MLFLAIGVLMIVLHFAGIWPSATWTWDFTGDLWKFCVPFALAVAWWSFADKSGMNKRREMQKMDDKKAARRHENMVSLGTDTRSSRKGAKR